jgi:iron complex outermembrane receptor protein
MATTDGTMSGQKEDAADTGAEPFTQEITVSAPRVDIPLKDNPAATTIVPMQWIESVPRGIAAEEVLDSVPGVKVDNQADGERVHVSIRGQGILTERGVRGIQVLLDGIPLNDATGFAPDLFDVDWATVDRVDVMRGPVGFLYGGGSSAGVITIQTQDGKSGVPVTGRLWLTGGSNAFWKGLAEASGGMGDWNYRVSASRNEGEGYRDHTGFDSTNVYGKLNWKTDDTLNLTFVVAGTNFFNQNAEGLNLAQVEEDRTQANPDAITFNEYQKTERFTGGMHGAWNLRSDSILTFTAFGRRWKYRESVPSSVIHRTYSAPGGNVQYELYRNVGKGSNSLIAGLDLDGQWIDDVRHPNLGNAVEGEAFLADSNIDQSRVGLYLMDRVEFNSQWTLLVGLRRDRIHQNLVDNLKYLGLDLSGEATFSKTTGRIGVTYNPKPDFGIYASWGQGFIPPATEELYANPVAFGGFNTQLVPATSRGEEVGVRGNLNQKLYYDVAFFHLLTDNDFERYRVPSRPLETFYHNAGDSRRYGLETGIDYFPISQLTLHLAYAFADYVYTSYNSFAYPGNWTGNSLPNSPAHLASIDAEIRPYGNWIVGLRVLAESRAYIDVTNDTWIDGYGLLDARIGYRVKLGGTTGEIQFTARNLTGTKYIAFTEPDPDGNSYQPGPEREFFGGFQILF